MTTQQIDLGQQLGTDLSSRQRAGTLRREFVRQLDTGLIDLLVLDLSSVRSISHSCADELFSVLVAERGEAWFKTHIQVTNMSAIVRQTILEAIQLRLETHHRLNQTPA